ncbi:MAG: hypothetical protein MJ252_22290, partial [archaeon]|nr:hypothetical protein [archaeon]
IYTHKVRGKTGRAIIRFRIKVIPNTGVEGGAFRAGVYDKIMKAYPIPEMRKKITEIKEGWQWYELDPLELNENRYYYFATNFGETKEPAIDSIYFDRLEFVESE